MRIVTISFCYIYSVCLGWLAVFSPFFLQGETISQQIILYPLNLKNICAFQEISKLIDSLIKIESSEDYCAKFEKVMLVRLNVEKIIGDKLDEFHLFNAIVNDLKEKKINITEGQKQVIRQTLEKFRKYDFLREKGESVLYDAFHENLEFQGIPKRFVNGVIMCLVGRILSSQSIDELKDFATSSVWLGLENIKLAEKKNGN